MPILHYSRMLTQLRLISPQGRAEVVWATPVDGNDYRISNVPVWAYGLSLGSLIRARSNADGELVVAELIEPSPGATFRCVVPPGKIASALYLDRIVPDMERIGLGIGPATFFDPRLVAIHLHDRRRWWPAFGEYLNSLVDGRDLQEWEVADPDQHGDDSVPEPVAERGTPLMHERPTTDVSRHFRL